jgi:multiple sugar transport system permease protein
MLIRLIQTPRRLLRHSKYGEYFWAFTFVLPIVLIFGAFAFYPVFASIVTSMQRFTGFSLERPFIGFDNYAWVLGRGPVFWKSVWNTLVFTVGTVPVAVFLPLGLAALINRLHPAAQTAFKSAFYLPGVVSSVVVALIWLWILYPLNAGLANWVVRQIGLGGPFGWLANVNLAMPSLIATVWFSGHGAAVILYLAAMGGIPTSLYEAAELDYASGWSKFRNVTWPLIMPTTLFVLVIATINSFQVFDLIYTMTSGGPQLTTSTVVFHIFRVAFVEFEFGKASAMAVMLGIVIILVSVIQFRLLSTEVEY